MRIQRQLLVLVSSLFLGLAACSSASQRARLSYPEARQGDVVEDYHGVAVTDPYRWMEALDSPQTQAWIEAENALSQPFLEAIPQRQRIIERLKEVWNYERYGIPFKEGGKYFFTRNDGLQDQSVLYTADSPQAQPRPLIDPNTFSRDATVALSAYQVSPDGKKIAYALSDGGSDWKTWKIREVESGQDLKEEIRFTKFTGASWARDSKGFFYSRYPEATAGQGDGMKSVSIYFHQIGRPQSEDERVYAIPAKPRENPYPRVTEDGRYLIISVSRPSLANAVYYKSLSRKGQPVKPLMDQWDARYRFLGNQKTLTFFQTNKDAPRSRVIAVELRRRGSGNWREIIPEAEETLRAVSLVGGRLVARYLKDAHALVRVFDTRGKLEREVDLPGIGSVSGFRGHGDDPETFYRFTGFTSPGTLYRYNVVTGERELYRQPKVAMDLDPFATRQIFYQSKDGTRIPMFLIHRKGIELNGQNPTLLYGYGGFNISLTPSFNVARLVWVELGGVLAIPNLRGGGEYGEAWHLAGTKTHKQNVFDDFIAAARWLIEKGYTSASKLAIQGASNGGLLVGAALTQRPDLFGAALPAVGVLDMLRYHTASANARQWSSDYGVSENEEEFKALYAYSPYHNIHQTTCYPPTLITTADHDDRVVPWHSLKFGARLQHAQDCANPILVRVETRAGHGAGKPTWMRIEEVADRWAFLVRELGMEVGEHP
ncbi:MAG: prolyl oligopeptidase family protein [Acidobacteriota bacterium]